VRILETVGRAIREMKSAPEKIVMLEVAMVRLTKPDLDHSYESLDERLTRLERGATHSPSAPAAPAPPALRPIGASVTAPAPNPTLPKAADERPVATAPPQVYDPVPASSPDANRSPSDGTLTLDDVRQRFIERVVPRTSRSAQLLLRSARVESLEGLLLTIAVPSEEMRQNTELIAQGLKGALEHEFTTSLTLQWIVDPTLTDASATPRRAPARPMVVDEEFVDIEDSDVTAKVVVVDSAASHLITEMFPGAEEIS
jgi:hypothetical protein